MVRRGTSEVVVRKAGRPKVLEICAGGGGQALGLELAGFDHAAAVEIDSDACRTLRQNRPEWNVINGDLKAFSAKEFRGVDLVAGGVPCPPFSIAGKQLGPDDERDLFPDAIRIIAECQPRAVMLENVRGLATEKFSAYREGVIKKLKSLGYEVDWKVLNASDFGVPQLRPRFLMVALRPEAMKHFKWPKAHEEAITVADSIGDLMGSRGWPGAAEWKKKAAEIAPTIVGGSKKHGGPDLGPTRARAAWAELGVEGRVLAAEPPGADFPAEAMPKLTVRMVARIQGFPDSWQLVGNKTASYRQIGNAFPPPVAQAVGTAIRTALTKAARKPKEAAAAVTLPLQAHG